MPRREPCAWLTLREALARFTEGRGAVEAATHIKPLHWYIASRLVIEGGFLPEEISPRPPFTYTKKGSRHFLEYEPSKGGHSERTILGGLKTKNVDVVVVKDGIGPVMAISCKGITGAYRNLTNRMEESVGECTNLHITYPALVMGYFVVASGHGHGTEGLAANDFAYTRDGTPVGGLSRFHYALSQLTGRRGVRDDVSRYEAVALAMVEPTGPEVGHVQPTFPPATSSIHLNSFFQTLYQRYEERFVFGAPRLVPVTMRHGWSEDSLAFSNASRPLIAFDYEPRPPRAAQEEADLATQEDEGDSRYTTES